MSTAKPNGPLGPLRCLHRDLQASLRPNPNRPVWVWWVMVALKTYALPRVRTLWCYRLGQLALRHHLPPAAWLLLRHAQKVGGAEVDPRADIGPGIDLWHTSGLVIGPDAVIGSGLTIMQGVTIGVGSTPGMATIGDDAFIGCGAIILGGVKIGHRAKIGANATITTDVPDGAVALGQRATTRQ